MNNISLSNIAKSVIKEYETQEINSDLEKEMGAALAKLTAGAKSIKPEDKIETPEVTEVLDPVSIIGLTLAAPKLIQILASAFGGIMKKLNKYFKKGAQPQDNESEIAKSIIEFSHKWHGAYIKTLQYALEMFGVFAKSGITNSADKKKATEMLYYTLIAGLSVYSGVGAASAFKSAMASKDIAAAAANFNLSALEAAMTKIKAGEVQQFLKKVML